MGDILEPRFDCTTIVVPLNSTPLERVAVLYICLQNMLKCRSSTFSDTQSTGYHRWPPDFLEPRGPELLCPSISFALASASGHLLIGPLGSWLGHLAVESGEIGMLCVGTMLFSSPGITCLI